MSVYFQTITTPIDLRPIGLDMTLNTQEDVENFLTKITTVDKSLNTLASLKFPDGDTFFSGSIEIDGNMYTFSRHAGNGGYGATAIVQNKEGHFFALKEQISDGRDNDNLVVKEAIINYILYLSTAPGRRPFTPKIHRIFYSTRTTTEGDKKSIYILSESLSITGFTFLASVDKTDGSVILYSQLVERLKELFKIYNFNHGDLKPANVMFDYQGNLRLIDFGFSRLVLNKGSDNEILIETSTVFTANSSDYRDLTFMAASIRYSFKNETEDFVDTIEKGYGCSLSQVMMSHYRNCNRTYLSNMQDVYIHINNFINQKGKFDTVLPIITPLIEDLKSKPNQEHTLATIYKTNPDPSQPLPEQPSPKTLAEALEGGGGANRGPKPVKRGGAKVKRKTKSKRIYRNYGKSRRKTTRIHSSFLVSYL